MALLSDPALLLLDEPTTGMDVEGRRAFWSAIRAGRRAGPHRAVRDPLPRGGRPVRRPDRADQPGPDRRRRHRLRDQGAGRRPHRPRHPRRRPTTEALAAPRRASSRVEVRGDTVLRARQGQRRGRPLPAHPDRRPRPRDHLPRPRGRLPQPHRRRRRPTPTTTPHPRRSTDDHAARSTRPPAGSRRSAASTSPCSASSSGGCSRNRRTIIFTLVFPAALFFAFGSGTGLGRRRPATATWRPTSWSRWRCTAPR